MPHGTSFSVKTVFPGYKDSYYEDEVSSEHLIFIIGIFYTDKMIPLYWSILQGPLLTWLNFNRNMDK